MRHANAADPRHVIVSTKFFTIRPQPLEEYLWDLNLSRTEERVFWLHWQEGHRRGDWTSEIPISVIARRCRCDISTVTRAYQTLRRHGLLRRQSPGRDPNNPFREAVAVTEVVLPTAQLGTLLGAPNRRSAEITHAPAPSVEQEGRADTALATGDSNHSELTPQPTPQITPPPSRESMRRITAKFSLDEQKRWYQTLRASQTGSEGPFQPDANSSLSPQDLIDLERVLAGFRRQVMAERVSATKAVALIRQSPPNPLPKMSLLDQAYLRRQLASLGNNLGAPGTLDECIREITWSIETGALQRFGVRHAINIAVKKVRTLQWTRPNRMPPNWRAA